jgi:hypothetical protein
MDQVFSIRPRRRGLYLSSIPHFKVDTGSVFRMGSLSLETAGELLSDPTWTTAMFVRDPAERLLSAYYFDKVAGKDYYTRSHFKIYNGTEGYFKREKEVDVRTS